MKVQKRQLHIGTRGPRIGPREANSLLVIALALLALGYFFEYFLLFCLGLLMIAPLAVLPLIRKGEQAFQEESALARAEVIELNKERSIFEGGHFDVIGLLSFIFSLVKKMYTYSVIFQFNAGGVHETGEQYLLKGVITKPIYESLQVGGSVTVRYLKSNPRKAFLQGEAPFNIDEG